MVFRFLRLCFLCIPSLLGFSGASGNSLLDRLGMREAVLLGDRLREISFWGFWFGHQSSTLYGNTWVGEPQKSEPKDVCGDFSAAMGLNLADISDKVSCNSAGLTMVKLLLAARAKELIDREVVVVLNGYVHSMVSNPKCSYS